MKSRQRALQVSAIAFGLVACPSLLPAVASEVQGQVLELAINKTYGGAVFIRMDKAPTSPIGCSINGYWHYTLPLATDVDKRMFAMLLTAQTTGKSMYVSGLGSCNEFGAVESAAGVRM